MPLVNYTSDSDSESEPNSRTDPPDTPPRKRPRRASLSRSQSPSGPGKTANSATSSLPPLPASFHDLYASTVRTTVRDEPSLHQGRVRQTPHVAGNWPSHIYVEWHPAPDVHALLADLVARLQKEWVRSHSAATRDEPITSFLLSDLAAPLPLHISLSRPVVLGQGEKDAFLDEVKSVLLRGGSGGGGGAFKLRCGRVEWHRTAESGRSFLVLRLQSCCEDSEGEDGKRNSNPELTELLRRCNEVVRGFGQPELYQWAEDGGDREVGDAFHVSIAWSFAETTEELKRVTERVFGETGVRRRIEEVEIPVEGVKVKIGNVVTHVALPQPGLRASGRTPKNLLGL